MNYTGIECPVCGKPFTDQDEDIVVCPECGAPHHRECYTAHGKCGCAEQHGTDQAWDKRQKQQQQETPKKACPFCHEENDENAVFCVHCGRPMSQPTPPPYGPFGAAGRPPYGVPPQPPGGFAAAGNPFDPMGGVAPTDDLGGATAEQVSKVVRMNTRYYLPVFSRIQNFNKCRFNFMAFIFGASWLFYRKQYQTGIIIGAITLALRVASIVLNSVFTVPMLHNIYADMGVSVSTIVSNNLMNQVVDAIRMLPAGQMFLFFSPLVCYALIFAVNIFVGVKANRWYKTHCVRVAADIKQNNPTIVQTEEAYQKRGGVNMVFAVAMLAIYMLIGYIPMMFT